MNTMDVLFQIIEECIKRTVSPEVKSFFIKEGKVYEKKKKQFFTEQDEFKHDCCFLTDGLVARQTRNRDGHRTIHSIIQPSGFFTGSNHIFSDTPHECGIQFLQPSKIVVIPSIKMRLAQEAYPDINLFMHILKQHKLLWNERLSMILQQPDLQQRYIDFKFGMPELNRKLNVEEIMALLQIKLTSYKLANARYIRMKDILDKR